MMDFDDAHDDISRWTKAINYYSAKPPIPLIRSIWFPSSVNRKLKRTLQQFHVFLQQMIDERRREVQQRDLLSVILHAKAEDSADADDANAMSDNEMRDEALGMIIGGHETSASALTWLWYELSRHPPGSFSARSRARYRRSAKAR